MAKKQRITSMEQMNEQNAKDMSVICTIVGIFGTAFVVAMCCI